MLNVASEKADSPKGFLSSLLNLKADAKDNTFSLLLKSFSLKGDNTTLDKGAEPINLLAKLSPEEGLGKAKPTPLAKLFALGAEEEVPDEEHIHPNILKALPTRDLKGNIKTLINEAKSFLKEQIVQVTGKQEESLPKTLGGLIKLAKESGIDVKAIEFESLPKTPLTEKISTLLPKVITPLSTSEIVKNEIAKSEIAKPNLTAKNEKEGLKPLAALLSDEPLSLEPEIKNALSEGAKKTPLSQSVTNLLYTQEDLHEEPSDALLKVDGTEKGKAEISSASSKVDQLNTKIVEAKQLLSNVAANIRESVENYKPPFTRIKMQLNPHKFGEMDITMVQRGNNVHININSSPSAMTVMIQNANELKNALSAQGLGDASMNFSSHQHDGQRQEQAKQSYEEFQNFDEFEDEFQELTTSLEIVVPRYI